MKKIFMTLFFILAFTECAFAFEDVFVEEKPPVTSQELIQEQKVSPDIPFDWFEINADVKADRIKEILARNESLSSAYHLSIRVFQVLWDFL